MTGAPHLTPVHWGRYPGRVVVYHAGRAVLEVSTRPEMHRWARRALEAATAGEALALPGGSVLAGSARLERFARDLLALRWR